MFTLPMIRIHPDPQPTLHPHLTPHFRKTRQCSREREPLLITTENRRGFERLHRQSQIVHHHAHRVGEISAVVVAAVLEGAFDVVGREEEVGEGDFGGEDEFCL